MTLTPFNLYNTFLPSAFLFSPLFSPIKFDKNSSKVFFRSERTKNESLTYFGYILDCGIDLKLYSLIINKSFDTKDYSIVITRNEIFDVLKTAPSDRHCTKFKSYIERIKRFKSCKFFLDSSDNNRDLKNINSLDFNTGSRSYSLVDDYLVSSDNKSIKIYLKYSLKYGYISQFNMQLLNLNHLSNLETKYEKSIYLMFITKTFKTKKFFYVNKDKLYSRIGGTLSKKRVKEIVLQTLQNFVKLKLISGFEDYNFNSFKIYTNN